MTNLQIENLYIFYFLYNGCDSQSNLPLQSPDYLLEKWEKLIGIVPSETKYPELENIKIYQEWSKIWLRGNQSPIPDSLMMFMVKTHPSENKGFYPRFVSLVDKFEKYIGKSCNITQEQYDHVHPTLVKSVQNIIERTVEVEDVRNIIINNILS